MSSATSSFESMIPSEFRSHGIRLVPSVLVSNVLPVVPIGHDSRSLSKSTMPNTLPSVMTSKFPIFHSSDLLYISPSYILSNAVLAAISKLSNHWVCSRPSVMQIE